MKIESAGIIAAGEGSRFKKVGMTVHKPMIPVGGFPLIGHVLKNFQRADIKRVVIIFNESEGECVDWVKQNFSALQCEFIVKSTRSSYESFWRVGQKLGAGRHLISTVDSLSSPQEVQKMMDCSSDSNESEKKVYLGVVSTTDDEKPLWVKMNEQTKQIQTLGEKSGEFVTAGFYNVPGSLFQRKPPFKFSSLREYLKWLVKSGVPVVGVPLSAVVDVDLPKDIPVAEELVSSFK